jgi:hypothetical protein
MPRQSRPAGGEAGFEQLCPASEAQQEAEVILGILRRAHRAFKRQGERAQEDKDDLLSADDLAQREG